MENLCGQLSQLSTVQSVSDEVNILAMHPGGLTLLYCPDTMDGFLFFFT